MSKPKEQSFREWLSWLLKGDMESLVDQILSELTKRLERAKPKAFDPTLKDPEDKNYQAIGWNECRKDYEAAIRKEFIDE